MSLFVCVYVFAYQRSDILHLAAGSSQLVYSWCWNTGSSLHSDIRIFVHNPPSTSRHPTANTGIRIWNLFSDSTKNWLAVKPLWALTYRVIGSISVHTSTIFKGYALVVAEDEAWVTLTTLHTHVLTARWTAYTHACFWTGTCAQRVGAVVRTVPGFAEEKRGKKKNKIRWKKSEI